MSTPLAQRDQARTVDEQWQITTETARVYKARNSRTWAVATICEWPNGGRLDIQSDEGNFAFAWNSIGKTTLREFLMGLEYDYFMIKTHAGKGRRFSFEATINRILRDILDDRRACSLDKEEARERWDDVSGMEYAYSEDAFCHSFLEFDWAYSYCDFGSPAVQVDDPACRRFWSGPWVALKDQWRQELMPLTAEPTP